MKKTETQHLDELWLASPFLAFSYFKVRLVTVCDSLLGGNASSTKTEVFIQLSVACPGTRAARTIQLGVVELLDILGVHLVHKP